MNWKRNVITKRLRRHGFDLLRPILRRTGRGGKILANSFPKSGTHLLTQALNPLRTIDYGNFLASTPSFSMRENSNKIMQKKITNLIPGELVPGHLFHSPEIEDELNSSNVIHLFIYRDPRDVVISESHYLAHMNRWHKLHPTFKNLLRDSERFNLSIRGIKSNEMYYPNIGERMARYSPWLKSNNVFQIKFEDIIGNKRKLVLTEMYKFLKERIEIDISIEEIVNQSLTSIKPESSHTFRSGKTQNWKKEFSEQNCKLFSEYVGDELKLWGY